MSVLELVARQTGPDFADHLIRALIFRLVAHSEAVKAAGAAAAAAVDPEMERFDLVYDLVKRFQRGPLGSAGSRAFDAVLCDVDGVVRHWPPHAELESAHGLAPGAFAAVAFAPGRLLPAITGEVTDERWRENVAEGLVAQGHCATPAEARAVIADWNGLRPRVDDDVLALLQLAREVLPVVLVSNATSRCRAAREGFSRSIPRREIVPPSLRCCRNAPRFGMSPSLYARGSTGLPSARRATFRMARQSLSIQSSTSSRVSSGRKDFGCRW